MEGRDHDPNAVTHKKEKRKKQATTSSVASVVTHTSDRKPRFRAATSLGIAYRATRGNVSGSTENAKRRRGPSASERGVFSNGSVRSVSSQVSKPFVSPHSSLTCNEVTQILAPRLRGEEYGLGDGSGENRNRKEITRTFEVPTVMLRDQRIPILCPSPPSPLRRDACPCLWSEFLRRTG